MGRAHQRADKSPEPAAQAGVYQVAGRPTDGYQPPATGLCTDPQLHPLEDESRPKALRIGRHQRSHPNQRRGQRPSMICGSPPKTWWTSGTRSWDVPDATTSKSMVMRGNAPPHTAQDAETASKEPSKQLRRADKGLKLPPKGSNHALRCV